MTTHNKRKMITLMIPSYNEEETLPALYKRLTTMTQAVTAYDFELLFINDGSTDNTIKLIHDLSKKDKQISYVSMSRNYGKEIAMIAGFDHVRGDAVVVMDADLQDPPELVPTMIKYWEEGYDDVYARRISRSGETWLKKLTSKMFYRTLQKTTRIPIQPDTGDFRLLDKRCVEALKQMRESQRYTKGMFSWIGYKKKEITYKRDPRVAGTTKWNYWKLFDLAIEGITSFTTMPLRASTLLGVFVSFLAFMYIVVILVRTLLFGIDAPGYASMMAAILFMGGVQLLSLGIIGEYVGRIFNETKGRPLYFVDEYHTREK